MAVTKIKPIKSTLSKALDYIENPDKTDGKMLVSSFGCSYETADIEFEYTLSQALQKGNNLAFHLIQSFEPGEVDYQKAHEIGKQLADAVTKGQHEYVLTTHIDKGHVHNHIIFCAVNFVDHRKYNSNKRSYYGIRNMSDKLCRENGLSVVVPGKGSKGKSYAEYQAEKTGTSWKGKLKIAVDALIPQVSSFEELLQRLQAAGYEIKPGKYLLWLLPVLSSPPFCSPFWYAPRRYAPRRARLRRCPVPVLPPAHGEAAARRLWARELRRPVWSALPVPAAAVLRSLQSPRPLSAC